MPHHIQQNIPNINNFVPVSIIIMWSSHSKFSWWIIYFGLRWKFGWYSSQVRWRFCIYLYWQCWFFCVSNSWYVHILISFFFTIAVFYLVKYTLGMMTRFCLNSNCCWKVGMIVILGVILIFVWLRQVDWLTMGMIIFATALPSHSQTEASNKQKC